MLCSCKAKQSKCWKHVQSVLVEGQASGGQHSRLLLLLPEQASLHDEAVTQAPFAARLLAHAASPAEGSGAGASSALVVATPGLQNAAGEYNCFLNVVVQCLWRCARFRAGLLRLDPGQLQARALLCSLWMPSCAAAPDAMGLAPAVRGVPPLPAHAPPGQRMLPACLIQTVCARTEGCSCLLLHPPQML